MYTLFPKLCATGSAKTRHNIAILNFMCIEYNGEQISEKFC